MKLHCINPVLIGANIKRLRLERGLSVADVVDYFDKRYFSISEQSVYRWERGASVPRIDHLCVLMDLFGVTLDELLFGDSDFQDQLADPNNDITQSECMQYAYVRFLMYVIFPLPFNVR